MTQQQPKVLIAGYGQMGHAMETLLANRARLSIWAVTPQDLEPPAAIHAASVTADLLLLCLPTAAHPAVLGRLVMKLRPDAAVLSIAKGLDPSGRCASDILEADAGGRSWGVLGGPMIANEIIAGRPAFATLGSYDKTLLPRAQELYRHSGLEVVERCNPQAVSWCGILKNVYAPLVGISDELAWGDNARGHIVMAALREMHVILAELTGDAMQAFGDAGLADFVTTVTSPHSHHYALGRRVARGDFGNLGCEGLHSLQVLIRCRRVDPDRHPLLGIAAHLVREGTRLVPSLHDWLAVA